MGSATIIAIVETSIVPMTSGNTPKRLLAKSGVHSVPKRKSPIGTSRKKPAVSIASTTTMPIVVKTDSAAHTKSARSMTHSIVRLLMHSVPLSGGYCRSLANSCSMVTPTWEPPSPNTVPVRRALKCSVTSAYAASPR